MTSLSEYAPTAGAVVLSAVVGCTAIVRFPPDLQDWGWDSGWDSGDSAGVDTADTVDDDVGSSPPKVDLASVSWGCDPAETAWQLQARTIGESGGLVLNVFGTGAWSEQHEALRIDRDPDGEWDAYRGGPLADGVTGDVWEAGENSVFDCVTDADSLTMVLRLDDPKGDLADCVVWGADPDAADGLLADAQITALGGCRWMSLP